VKTPLAKAPTRTYSRHTLTVARTQIKLRGFGAVDRRTAAARSALQFREQLADALGGDGELSPQQRKLIDLAVRVGLMLDHVDAWILAQRSLVNARSKTLLPIVLQRQGLAEHLAKLIDRLGVKRVEPKAIDIGSVLAADAQRREARG
jgi:hypothetical protein